MRIAHVTAVFPPYASGTGNVCYHNARELVRLGHEVHVFTAAQTDAKPVETVDGIQIHRLRPLLRYGNAPLLPSLYKRLQNFDIVHLHMPFYGGSEAIYMLKRRIGLPLVITYHQDVKLTGVAGAISRWHDKQVAMRLFKAADCICFTSLDYGSASKFAGLVKTLPVAELPNGVDPTLFHPGPRPKILIERHKLQNKQVLLFVGALDRAHYFKGVDVLLEAVARLSLDTLALIVVGSGDLKEHYRQLARQLGVEHAVHFTGFVENEMLPEYYRLADATVLPSTTAGEAFGLVLLESLATATPVIASALPGVRTVVAHNTDGYLVEPGDRAQLAGAIEKLFALRPAERESMGRAGRAKVEQRYAWSRIAVRMQDLYVQVRDNRHVVNSTKHTAEATL